MGKVPKKLDLFPGLVFRKQGIKERWLSVASDSIGLIKHDASVLQKTMLFITKVALLPMCIKPFWRETVKQRLSLKPSESAGKKPVLSHLSPHGYGMDQILESHQHYSPNKSGRHWPQRLLAGFGPTAVSVHQCSKPETLLGEEKKKKKGNFKGKWVFWLILFPL